MAAQAARLVSPAQLAGLVAQRACVIVDCRFDLKQPAQGRADWLAGHIPGAVHADLDRDLAAPVTPASGRHPLPGAGEFATFLARSGWVPGRRIVAYDAGSGAFAVRLWWLMRYFGNDCVSLLDGGIAAWQAAGLPLDCCEQAPPPESKVELHPDTGMALDTHGIIEALDGAAIVLLDARDAARFAGEVEPIDPVAGHVPGAANRPFTENLRGDGRWRPATELRAAFEALGDPERVVHMCGSGVTACHNLFAMELAGLAGSRLYAGSWSEWIRDPQRPVATGRD